MPRDRSVTPPEILPRIRVIRGSAIAIGPGKVQLLAAVQESGSISKAAVSLGMSYKRAWDLIDTMNAEFTEPLVITRTGGSHGGGAGLSPTGGRVLRLYLAMDQKARRAIAKDGDQILALLKS